VLGRLVRDGELRLPLSPALGLAAFTYFFVPYLFNFIFSTTYLGIGFIALYVLGLRPLLSAGTGRLLSFLGEHSFELYLVHQPLMRECNFYVLWTYFPQVSTRPAAAIAGMLVGAGAALGIAVVLHRLLRPLARLVPREPAAAQLMPEVV
jgi:peptidoglycan/LPS O-acetylase OafA/YrhL